MLFTFPSRYSFAIGLPGVFSLAGWSRQIRAGFHVPRVTQDNTPPLPTSSTELSSSMVGLSRTFLSWYTCSKKCSYYPEGASPHHRFGLFPGRSPLLGESRLFSSPQGTKMFQFPWFASSHTKSKDSHPSGDWVVPFGNLGVKGHLRLTQAYRSLSRPSSPPGAKASTGRPNSLSPYDRSYILLSLRSSKKIK